MAKIESVVITDDLDGSSEAESVTFSFDGQGYEIDLSTANKQRIRESLQPFVDAGRLIGRPTPRRAASRRTDLAAIRAWAASQGLRISERGRISAEVMSKYDAAH